jgi:mRNA-degrading endonuclease RelE of RelBE toxin-antitoxin system
MRRLALLYGPQVRKDFAGIPDADRQRIRRRIAAYAEDAEAPGHDVVPLQGRPNTYRLRSGDWRVLFEIDGTTMKVHRIIHRREAYR